MSIFGSLCSKHSSAAGNTHATCGCGSGNATLAKADFRINPLSIIIFNDVIFTLASDAVIQICFYVRTMGYSEFDRVVTCLF